MSESGHTERNVMEGFPMSLRKRIESALVVLLVVVAALALAPLNASATHYPDGARCYDCHAVSGSKMVSGTNMIKTSPFTTQLQSAGWVPGNPLPCVFCHRKDAVSVPSVTKMKPVDGHFTASVASKHDANFVTAFATTYLAGDAFNCNHCHSGGGASITTGVVYDGGTGDANVHNISAAGAPAQVSLYGSLVNNGGTPNATTKAPHCLTTTCHGGATEQTIGGRTAKMDHAFAVADVTKPTVGGAFSDCSSCHATHRGEKQSSLMVLLNDGNVDAQDGTAYFASEYVTPNECDACHVQSKGTNQYVAKGHGNAAISGGSLTCTACHNENIPHVFGTGGSVANQLRFKFAENTTETSTIRRDPVHDAAYSICLTCHAQFASKIHKGPTGTYVAGCNDCHEPHGTGVNSNIKMIRTLVPKVDVSGVAVYGDASPTGTYETNTYTALTDTDRADGTSVCDNAECHAGRSINGNLIYPLFSGATPLMSASRHTGGDITADSKPCDECHIHTDSGGTFSAADSCTTCHGMPPTSTATTAPSYTTIGELNGPHKRHASAVVDGGYAIACTACHLNYANSTWHNTGLWNNTTQTFGNAANASYQSVFFDTGENPYVSTTTSGTLPKTYNASYNISTRVCSDLYCHSNGVGTTSVNIKTTALASVNDGYANNDAIAWTEASWSTANLSCNSCHGGIDGTPGATQIMTGAHTDHLSNGITCNNCHFGTITGTGTDATMTIASTSLHVNKAKDVSNGGTYNSVAVSFTWNGTTCATVSCHGGWKTIAWTATDSCTNCHDYPPTNLTAGSTNHDATTHVGGGTINITIAALKSAHSGCDVCHGVSSSNDVTPVAFGTPKDETANLGDAYSIASFHMDGKVQMNGVSVPDNGQNTAYNEATTACGVACHDTSYVFNGTIRANTVQLIEVGKGGCNGCHGGDNASASNQNYWPGGTGTVYPDRPGEHNAHITKLIAQLGYNIATLTDQQQKTMCAYCHTYTTNPGESGHDSGGAPADISGFNPLWSALTANYPSTADGGTAATYTAGNGVDGTCAGIDCHNNKSTTATFDWYDGAATSCLMCHTDGGATNDPTSGLHAIVPTVSGVQHNNTVSGGCVTCHPTLSVQATHIGGTFTGNGTVAGDRTAMGLAAFYTNGGSDNNGTCLTTGASCHAVAPTTKEDDWTHKWSTPNTVYTNATQACQGCHGDQNGWNSGTIHRTSAAVFTTHGGAGTYRCKDCHALEATANTYTFTFGGVDWGGTSKHGNGTIEINNNGIVYNQTTNLCTTCHSTADGVHNFVDTTQTIAALAGDPVIVACGSCHTGGVRPAANSGAHAAHGVDAADLVAGGAACVDCHGNNGGLGFNSTTAGSHGIGGVVNFATASPTTVTYSTAVRNDLTGTCRTSDCHNRNTVADQSAAWNATELACDDCHYYSATPTLAGNNAHGRPLSTTHNDHFTRGKLCTQCHGTDPVASDTTHISGVTTLADKAVALQDEATLVWTHASALTVYTFEDTGNTCYTATNSGLGCHASAGDTGVADPTRPDWDVAFADCTSYCHSNKTDTASNPTSGLHGVVPSITGEQHDESFAAAAKGCADCHNVAALASHQNGAFTGNGSVAGDRTNMGLQNFTYTSSGADNSGTCTGTAAGCHDTTRNTWAHEWMATPANYQSATLSCGGCHGDWVNGWNAGVDHRTSAATQSTHGGTGTYDCHNCHNLESAAGNYTFTFGTTDWFPLNATSEHGNSSIEVNSNGTTYNATSGLCTACHSTSDGVHNFLDTTWTIANQAGDAIVIACTTCHTAAGSAPRVTSTSTHVVRGKNATYNTFNLCTDCHPGKVAGTTYHQSTNVVGIPENTTVGVDYPNTTYTTYSGYAGIVLGGEFTSGTTEAEICWNCHNNATYNTTAISEWGTNTDTNGAQFTNYNFGTLSGGVPAGDWLTSTWTSAVTYFSYKTGKLVDKPKYSAATGTTKTVVTNGGSIHSVNSAQTAPGVLGLIAAGVDVAGARALIRCSYCHDVHGAWTAAKMAGGKSPGGKPFLRGKWMGSPYREDGAPSAGQTAFPSLTYFGPVPRPTTLGTQVGGYQIDQNQGFTGGTVPYLNTTTWAAMNSAELCALCHAGGGTWATANSLDTINQFGTASTDWGIGRSGSMNGHSNVVIGGAAASTTYSFNLYKEVNRHPVASPYTTVSGTTSSSYRGAALMVQQQISITTNGSNPGGYSFRSQDSGGYRAQPQISGSTPRPWGSNRTWGVALNDTQNQANYHKFPCSKCHNPHASRLPRLLITNCLDTRNNTWDDSYSGITTQTGVAAENQSVRPSNWTAAMNCHRRRDSTFNKTWTGGPAIGADGWNALTPWW